jgi:uncharacterized cofD-like protein
MLVSMAQKPKYVVIGGGTGSFSLLSGLKTRPIDITALVSMADDGGSTGTLRDELGVLPPGDVRQCLIALSLAPEQLRNLFNYRFEDGALVGHSFGNLFLSAVEKMTNNFGEAVRLSSEVLRIRGRVVPITLDDVRLALELSDHTVLRGQRTIDDSMFIENSPHPHLFLEPTGQINPEAGAAIRDADVIVIAPGDLYTSLGPLLIVGGVAEALAASKAKVIYVCNLVVKPGHTIGMTVADHAMEIERLAGGKPIIDHVLYNTAKPSRTLLEKYDQAGELMVVADQEQLIQAHYRSVGRALVADKLPVMSTADRLAITGHRSFIRHDSEALAEAIMGF